MNIKNEQKMFVRPYVEKKGSLLGSDFYAWLGIYSYIAPDLLNMLLNFES